MRSIFVLILIDILIHVLIFFFQGDDQDLDDRVIKHLYLENQNLREELQMLRELQENSDKVEEGKQHNFFES